MLVAVRPYDYDAGPAWTIGGEDAYFPGNPTVPPASEAKYWFITDHTDGGSFHGWIQAPANLTKPGPIGTGDHWLRILSGAFFTTTGDRLTDPITFNVPLRMVDRLTTGLTSPTNLFQPGSHFRPGAQVTHAGRGFTPGATVEVTLDGAGLASSITTDGDGRPPASARVALPGSLAPGAHTLAVSTGPVTEEVPITATRPITAAVPTTVVRPGGTIAYDLDGYLGVTGAPQKIAVVVSEQVLACIEAGPDGSASGVVELPASISESVLVRFNVGLSCVLPPAGVINDQPISSSPHTLTVSPDAPAIAVVGSPSAGGAMTVTGSGFAPGSAVEVTTSGGGGGELTADSTGGISGPVTAPAAGSHRVLATQGATVAAAVVEVSSKRPAALTLTAPTKLTYGAARSTTVRLSIDGTPAAGTVVVSQGSWSKTVSVAAAGTSVALPRDAGAGPQTVRADFAGNDLVAAATATQDFVVTKASSATSIKPAKSKVKRTKRARATLKASISGAPGSLYATGVVVVYDGSKRIASYTLKAGNKGALKVTLPKIKKKGKHKLKVVYEGNENVTGKTSKKVTLKVT